MVLDSGGPDETEWKPGLFKYNNYKGAHPMAFGWGGLMQCGGGQKR